jgi:hypothetical protein
MNTISYYQKVNGDKSYFSKQSFDLLGRWKSNWTSKGWSPIILNEEYAKGTSSYDKIDLNNFDSPLRIASKENSNLEGAYHKHCYARWLAYCRFAIENGPVVWCDYDVYNKSLTPRRFNLLFSEPGAVLYSPSCAGGIMTPEMGESILQILEKISQVTLVKEAEIPQGLIDTLLTKEKQNGFNDMKVISSIFEYKRQRRAYIMSNLLRSNDEGAETFRSYAKKYDLFHLHGGTRSSIPGVKEKLVIKWGRAITRAEQWDVLHKEIEKTHEDHANN